MIRDTCRTCQFQYSRRFDGNAVVMIAGNGGVAIDDNSVAFTGDIDTIGFGRAGNSVFALEGYCGGFGIAFGVGNGDVGGFAGGEEPSDRARPATPLLLTVESVTVA